MMMILECHSFSTNFCSTLFATKELLKQLEPMAYEYNAKAYQSVFTIL